MTGGFWVYPPQVDAPDRWAYQWGIGRAGAPVVFPVAFLDRPDFVIVMPMRASSRRRPFYITAMGLAAFIVRGRKSTVFRWVAHGSIKRDGSEAGAPRG